MNTISRIHHFKSSHQKVTHLISLSDRNKVVLFLFLYIIPRTFSDCKDCKILRFILNTKTISKMPNLSFKMSGIMHNGALFLHVRIY